MGKFTAFNVPLKSLTEGTHTFRYHLDKEFFVNMESTDIHDADVNVVLTVNVVRDLYVMDFKFSGTVTVLCDRCLDDLIFPIETSYDINVRYGDECKDESDTLLEIPRTDNDLNVSYMIYDSVSLAIPIKHVHPAGKCNRQMSALLHKHSATLADPLEQELLDSVDEIDSDSGAATDPRWDVLKSLAGKAGGGSDSAEDNEND